MESILYEDNPHWTNSNVYDEYIIVLYSMCILGRDRDRTRWVTMPQRYTF